MAIAAGQWHALIDLSRPTPLQMVYHFLLFLIVSNIALVLLESMKEVEAVVGPRFFDACELISVLIFTCEYLMRLYSAKVTAKYVFNRWNFVTSFFGCVDLISIAPWYAMVALRLMHYDFDSAIFRVFRVFRILELEHFVCAFTLLDDVYYKSKGILGAAGILALIIWVGGATLFYIFEPELFGNVPNSMYYTAVFLGGEWGVVDYNVPNKILTIVFCVVAIALFSIPVATLFEAFADTLVDTSEAGLSVRVVMKERHDAPRADKHFTLRMRSAHTIGKVKAEIAGLCSVPVEHQVLVFKGQALRDTAVVGHISIRAGSTMRLQLPPDWYQRLDAGFVEELESSSSEE